MNLDHLNYAKNDIFNTNFQYLFLQYAQYLLKTCTVSDKFL